MYPWISRLFKRNFRAKIEASTSDNRNAWIEANKVFENLLSQKLWTFYIIFGFFIATSLLYLIWYTKKNRELKRRREEVQRNRQRAPQRRRPYAAHRNHAINRNAVSIVRPFMKIKKPQNTSKLSKKLKMTNSGKIYVVMKK
ncbi:uncharacterized protein LOC142234320 [Haematobia irritans]|uniref:uncharacterized protein LOC142234320 n=1 Tax=Haematobia irritans TaxID=7368 RepID=UPI003F507A0E